MVRNLYEKYSPGYDWHDFAFGDFKEIGAAFGFDISDIYFSGFSRQGDGACFEGSMQYRKGWRKALAAVSGDGTVLAIATQWAALQRKAFYQVSGTVKQSGCYSHEYCTSFGWESERGHHGWLNAWEESLVSDMQDCARDFMRWTYRQLEEEYKYQSAWEYARGWRDLGETMKETRQEARSLVSDMRAAIKSGIAAAPTICDALRKQLRLLLDQWEEMREEREQLDSEFWYYESGKSISIAEFAANNC
jgi:hypothetical protein